MVDGPTLGSFGEVDEEELEHLDDPPVAFTLVGYDRAPDEDGNHTMREYVFHALPTFEFWPWLTAVSKTDGRGVVNDAAAAQFLYDCLVEGEKQRWDQTIRNTKVHFEASILTQLTTALLSFYRGEVTDRPTVQRSASAGGPRRTGRTSTAGRSAKGSRSAAAV